jgi:ubiquinone/menaquinone biosynthesis C-methylase UbiE
MPPERLAKRAAFLDRLARERRRTLLEVGTGPGRDGVRFAEAGLGYAGVDLAPASVVAAKEAGLRVCVASVLELPFPDHSFEAAWTMSTLMHVAGDDFRTALGEIVRVLRPGAPLGIGLWGGERVGEGCWDDGSGFGPRFFSLRTDEVLRATLDEFATLEDFEVWPGDGGLHYQWAVLRTPAEDVLNGAD